MIRSVAIAVLLALAGTAEAADPPKPLAELVKQLRDPDREKRLIAVETIRDHYKDKALEVLPQLIETLGDELDRPPVQLTSREQQLPRTLTKLADMAGPERLKCVQEGTINKNSRLRAAAFVLWLSAAFDKNSRMERDAYLDVVQRGLKDDSPLVRVQAVNCLHAFQDWPTDWVAQSGFRDAPPEVIEQVVKLLAAALDDRVKPREGIESPAYRATVVLHNFREKSKPAIPSLAKAAAATDEMLVWGACSALRRISTGDDKLEEEVVKILRPLLSDRSRPVSIRSHATAALPAKGPAIRWAVQDLIDVLEEPGASVRLRRVAISVLEASGSRAAPAVPALVDRLEKTTDARNQIAILQKKPWLLQAFGPVVDLDDMVDRPLAAEQSSILQALKAIGPAAVLASDRLEKWMANQRDSELRSKALAALYAMKK